MKVIQVLPTVSFGDAVSNLTIAQKQTLKLAGYDTEIFAENIDERLPHGTALPVAQMPDLNPDDIMIYHLSTGSQLNYRLAEWRCRKILQYHNITPPGYFAGYHARSVVNCEDGLEAAHFLNKQVDYCLADSEFNRQDLIRMGYEQKIDVLPVLIPYDDYKKVPSEDMLTKLRDGKKNFLFVGRIAPNKKYEDLIKAFYYYKNEINADSRLILAGSARDMDLYQEELLNYVEILELKDVMFTGQIRFDEILACYQAADAFVCMSEHEGFCVPVVEAMIFELPVVAVADAAVPETLGRGGLLTKSRNPKLMAEMMNCVVENQGVREYLSQMQKEQLKRYDTIAIQDRFLELLREFRKDGGLQ